MAKKLNVEEMRKGDFEFITLKDDKVDVSEENSINVENTEGNSINIENTGENGVEEVKSARTRRKRIKKEKIAVSAYLSPTQHEFLISIADTNNLSISDTVAMIIEDYSTRESKKRKKAEILAEN